TVMRNNQQVMMGRRDETGLYKLHEKKVHVNNVQEVKLWHERMGHLSKENLNRMTKECMVENMDMKISTEELNCQTCQKGKQARKAISKTPNKIEVVKEKGDRIHTDICGPIEPETFGGSRYFISFIDEHTRKSWIYLMRTKDQALQKFKEFWMMMDNQHD